MGEILLSLIHQIKEIVWLLKSQRIFVFQIDVSRSVSPTRSSRCSPAPRKIQISVSVSTPSASGSGRGSSPVPSPSFKQYMNMNKLSINSARSKLISKKIGIFIADDLRLNYSGSSVRNWSIYCMFCPLSELSGLKALGTQVLCLLGRVHRSNIATHIEGEASATGLGPQCS